MLIQSKNKNEKIILGLLSYTLEEGQHQTDLLQSILETYRQSDSKEIYLYREQDQDNFIGLVGVETFQSRIFRLRINICQLLRDRKSVV